MKSQRQLQIGETIKRNISEVFTRDDILTVPGSFITILEADVSPDAKNVKVFIDIFGNEKMHEKIVEKLNEMAPYFRHQLSKRVSLRVAPELTFILDKTQDKAMKLEDLIAQEAKRFEKDFEKKPVKKVAKKPAKKK